MYICTVPCVKCGKAPRVTKQLPRLPPLCTPADVHNRSWLQQHRTILHMAAVAPEWPHTAPTLLQVLDWLPDPLWDCVHRDRRNCWGIQQQHPAIPALCGLQHDRHYRMCDRGRGQFLLSVQVVVRGTTPLVCISGHNVVCTGTVMHNGNGHNRCNPPCPALPCPALPCPALPCPALPCPALPCPAPPPPHTHTRRWLHTN
jgi:hypothetical protein